MIIAGGNRPATQDSMMGIVFFQIVDWDRAVQDCALQLLISMRLKSPPLTGSLTTCKTVHLSWLLLCPCNRTCLLTGVTYLSFSRSQLLIVLLCSPILVLTSHLVFTTYALPQGHFSM
ncbi:hypothetical protein XELAEV_18040587mg [Xenopus laevis]|uniref:Uncharacterized protein n=1 Tax=Xenopus laevis TaxID=8355 RepID=A0A974CAU8_XENLA|nr:hypothetical protein XELAEV_18040587mg [Xenopus laevis]